MLQNLITASALLRLVLFSGFAQAQEIIPPSHIQTISVGSVALNEHGTNPYCKQFDLIGINGKNVGSLLQCPSGNPAFWGTDRGASYFINSFDQNFDFDSNKKGAVALNLIKQYTGPKNPVRITLNINNHHVIRVRATIVLE